MVKRGKTERVVFHHSLTDTGDVDTFRKYHVEHNGWEDIGYHFVVPKEGCFQHGRGVKYTGAHAAGKNYNSIGVCIVGNFEKSAPTDTQINECLNLYHGLCRIYNKNLSVEFHRDTPNPCPGTMLDRGKFIETMTLGRI